MSDIIHGAIAKDARENTDMTAAAEENQDDKVHDAEINSEEIPESSSNDDKHRPHQSYTHLSHPR